MKLEKTRLIQVLPHLIAHRTKQSNDCSWCTDVRIARRLAELMAK